METPTDVLTVQVRPVSVSDWAFIYDTFVKSASIGQVKLRPELYKRGRAVSRLQKALAYRIDVLRGRKAPFALACDPTDPDLLMGWASGEGTVLHYIYIKTAYRRQGIARQLVGTLGLASQSNLSYSVRTLTSEVIAEAHPGQLTYIGFD